MSEIVRAPFPANPLIDIVSISRHWSAGSLAWARWMMALLDAQTSLWKDFERGAANALQPWLDPALPAPSAQPYADAMQGVAPLAPAALQQAWAAWAQVWLNALRHDVADA